MIKIVTGHAGPGGSSIALASLVNLFNSNSMPACLYSNYVWSGLNCNKVVEDPSKTLKEIGKDDILIYHMMTPPRVKCKKMILSCHETTLFPIDRIALVYDNIHFVSQFQKEWQCVDGVVIPNPITKYKVNPYKGSNKIAGIIGSIDPNKRTHESVLKALEDGFDDIRLFGSLTDFNYFKSSVEPLLSHKVKMCGIHSDMQSVYDSITHAYHSPKLETFNLVKAECKFAGVTYVGNEGNDTQAEYWTDEMILNAWKNLIK